MMQEVAGSIPAEPAKIREPKLYAVTRRDLLIGLQCAQVGHALIAFALEHGPELPDNLVVLCVSNEAALSEIARQLEGIARVVAFREPDLDGALTALAVGPEAWRALSSLPLLR